MQRTEIDVINKYLEEIENNLNEMSMCALPAYYAYHDYENGIKSNINHIRAFLENNNPCQSCEQGINWCNCCYYARCHRCKKK